jgi:hypothetical protein
MSNPVVTCPSPTMIPVCVKLGLFTAQPPGVHEGQPSAPITFSWMASSAWWLVFSVLALETHSCPIRDKQALISPRAYKILLSPSLPSPLLPSPPPLWCFRHASAQASVRTKCFEIHIWQLTHSRPLTLRPLPSLCMVSDSLLPSFLYIAIT